MNWRERVEVSDICVLGSPSLDASGERISKKEDGGICLFTSVILHHFFPEVSIVLKAARHLLSREEDGASSHAHVFFPRGFSWRSGEGKSRKRKFTFVATILWLNGHTHVKYVSNNRTTFDIWLHTSWILLLAYTKLVIYKMYQKTYHINKCI